MTNNVESSDGFEHSAKEHGDAMMGSSSSKLRRCGLDMGHIMVALSTACAFLNYADRVNMSVCIIALGQEYSLNVTERGTVLSAFFWGYVPSQLLAALLCRRIGAKKVLGFGCAAWSLFTLLTPLAASYGFSALVACRLLMGLTEGVAFPSIYHIFGEWVPAAERGRATALLHAGMGLGTTVALLLSPHIIRIFSWRAVFHLFGGAGGVWLVAWAILARDAVRPSQVLSDTSTKGLLSPTELRTIVFMFRNRTCLALMASDFLCDLFHYTCLSWLPTYFNMVFNLKATEVSFTFIPYVTAMLMAPLGGLLSDSVASRTSRTVGRKVTTGLACVGAGLLVMAFSASRTVIQAVVAISASLGLYSLNAGGKNAAFLDVSEPQYVGLIKSLANTLGAASGAIAVAVATQLLHISGSWRFVFACQATWVFLAAAVFVKFTSSETTILTDARFVPSRPNNGKELGVA